jgi:hypothetical protein
MEDKIGFGKHFKLIWYTGYSNLFSVSLKSSKEAYESLANFTKFFAVLTFCLGILYSLIRKKWEILVLMIFLVPYFVAHAYYPYPIPRFHHTTFWIALIISFYGVIEFWRTLSGNGRIPRFVVMTMQITFIIGMLIWAVMIWKNLGLCADACPKVASLPYVLLGVSALLAVAYVLCHNFKGKLREFTVLTLMAVVLVSNQLSVASLMRGGNRDAEFKMLADWYSENAEKGEGLATSLASVVKIYVKKGKIVNYRDVQVGSLEEFVDYMDKRDVKYIAWDSRLGLAPKDPYYKLYGLDVIKPLVQPVDRGRLKFVKRFENGKRFINLFEIQDGESVN